MQTFLDGFKVLRVSQREDFIRVWDPFGAQMTIEIMPLINHQVEPVVHCVDFNHCDLENCPMITLE